MEPMLLLELVMGFPGKSKTQHRKQIPLLLSQNTSVWSRFRWNKTRSSDSLEEGVRNGAIAVGCGLGQGSWDKEPE